MTSAQNSTVPGFFYPQNRPAGTSASDVELAEPASSRFTVRVTGGDAVFLADLRFGHRLYIGPKKPLPKPELRCYVLSLSEDLDHLSIAEFIAKYRLSG